MPFSYVFKLADFGTARELGPDETFISLYGTEEYLFPGLYERALVNPGNRTKFSAKVHIYRQYFTPSLQWVAKNKCVLVRTL